VISHNLSRNRVHIQEATIHPTHTAVHCSRDVHHWAQETYIIGNFIETRRNRVGTPYASTSASCAANASNLFTMVQNGNPVSSAMAWTPPVCATTLVHRGV
jgi:hypothetical protein